MIHAIAIDQDPILLLQLEELCSATGNAVIGRKYSHCEKAYNELAGSGADAIFVNAGLDFVKLIARKAADQHIPVVFMAKDGSLAVEAFNCGAADFLLQPFRKERFGQAIEKIYGRRAMQHYKTECQNESLSLRVDYTVMKLPLARILYIEGLDDYIRIVMHGQKPIVTRMTLKRLETQLPGNNFARIHKSYIVPVHRISYVRNKIVHIGEHRIPLGSTYEQRFFQSIQHA
jgi:DNA-binding LytR/AlgR family response regulator